MIKFRKMPEDLTSPGPMLTTRYDRRLTRVGRALERTKLDELPQLLNVLLGHMSIIGPRPEVPQFVQNNEELWDVVLSTKPGIFGPSQLANRNESELYPPGQEDIEGYYVEHILPEKLALDAAYAQNASITGDVGLLMRGIAVAAFGAITWQTVVTRRVQIANLLLLSALGFTGTVAAILLSNQDLSSRPALQLLAVSLVAKPASLIVMKVPKALATSMTPRDIQRLLSCTLASTAIAVFAGAWLIFERASWIALVLDAAFFLTALFVYKLLLYTLYLVFVQEPKSQHRAAVWISAGLAPLSVAAVAAGRASVGDLSSPNTGYLVMAAASLLIRPLMTTLFLRPQPRPRTWVLSEWPRLVATTLAGSSLILLAVVLSQLGTVPLTDIAADAVIFGGLATGIALWAEGRLDANGQMKLVSADTPQRPSVIVVGSGIELSSYVASLDSIPESDIELLGVVTPSLANRTRTVGGQPVVGEITDLPEILDTLIVDTLVVLESSVDQPLRSYVEAVAARYGSEYFGTHVLPSWKPNGRHANITITAPTIDIGAVESVAQDAT
jgi:hypothetical protein